MSRSGKVRKTGPDEPGFVLDDYILYNLVRTTATYTEEMAAALKAYGLDTMKWRILMLLHDRSPSTVGDLARRSVTKTPTLTRVLIRMENEGLVVRRALKDDRRVVQVTMTPKAAKVLNMVRSIGQKVFERAFENIPEENIALMTAMLKDIRTNLTRSPYDAVDVSVKRAKA